MVALGMNPGSIMEDLEEDPVRITVEETGINEEEQAIDLVNHKG